MPLLKGAFASFGALLRSSVSMNHRSLLPLARRWLMGPAFLTPVLLLSHCSDSGSDAPSATGGSRAAGSGGADKGSGGGSLASGGTSTSASGGSDGAGPSGGATTSSSGGSDAAGGAASGGSSAAGAGNAAGAATAGTATTSGGDSGAAGASATAGSAGAAPGGGLSGGTGFYRMERLNRGVVAIKTAGGVYVGWRMLGFEYDASNAANVAYNLYRDGTKIATVTDSTNYQDADGALTSTYTVRPVLGGVEGAVSESAKVWENPYLRIPLQIPPGGTTPGADKCGSGSDYANPNEAYTYTANDASVADLDGDGQYEIILKWDPTNARDNSQDGCTGNQILDAYKFDLATGASMRLWRIDLGRNIRAGAHYTQFIVYDFDGDGKAEMAVKTAPGSKDGTGAYLKLGPAANDDDNADYRGVNNDGNKLGYVLSGPEYLTVFDGLTGAERATVAFDQARGTVSAWGDAYGNRVDRFLATAAYLDDTGLPSFVMARGYYTRTTLTAWNFRNGQLTQLWKFDSNVTKTDAKGNPYTGQGSHSLSVANVDSDPEQEILYGAMAIDHDGKGKCSSGLGHGDALHVSDFILSRPGLEVFMPHEDKSMPTYDIRDANTCALIVQSPNSGKDQGRGVAADVNPDNPGAEMWAGTNYLDAATGKDLGGSPKSTNFLVWWDADESRELEDGTTITKFNGAQPLLTASGCASNNGTKSTPTLLGDIIGDWREEVIWRESNNSALRLYVSTAVTKRRIYTLLHDAQYRIALSWQNVAYNQPPHPSFHIGGGMAAPPTPNITVK